MFSEKWTVIENGFEITCVGYDQRGIYGVPVTANGICAEVAFIQLGAYDRGDYISLTRPTSQELAILDACGWEFDGCFAHKIR